MASPRPPQPPPLPAGLPVPIDDGQAAHLPGARLPSVRLRSTLGQDVDLAQLGQGRLVLFVYPKTGRPGQADPPGWDAIPGARGCTQQSCAFRDLADEFAELGYVIAGLSAQPSEEQQEAAGRLQLTYPLLADPDRQLARTLRLPTFEAAGMTLYKRLVLIAHEGRIAKAFYPVFPPDKSASDALEWVRSGRTSTP